MTAEIDPAKFGVSFSLKQCRNFGIDQGEALDWLLEQGWRRFRLTSYWDEHETTPGHYNFKALDAQIAAITKAGGVFTLCLGARQPRWPENHWPDWAWLTNKPQRTVALLRYIEVVVNRYKDQPGLIGYQLENEALLKHFGKRPEIDRARLRAEFALIKRLDPVHQIIMSTSTSWGIPLRRPIPDLVGFSYYHVYWNGSRRRYQTAGGHYIWLHRLRAWLIWELLNRRSFIHELQCEPWPNGEIWAVSLAEQDKSMDTNQIHDSFRKAKRTGLYPIDIWGAEWWYWRWRHGDPTIWQAVEAEVRL